ncbi:ABC transporter permease [Butyrivibrio sp. AE2032]|uniref:ABC transporter permease n=1 Tax=Butyrivibrio sp. AE2032 TaxID=1458463 RepID=UPI00055098E2|nr:ABC transporter permease [Butyrivibrio sp. AE2032]
MKTGFYPKMAVSGMRKNGRLYLPYIAACILMVAVFYIMHLLGYSEMLEGFEGAGTARDMLRLGTIVMAVFGTIFLFYTQATLIKGRLKEFGLYSVLGMSRKNLGKIIFYETVITWFVSVTGGTAIGIGLSKLAELAFRKMIGIGSSYRFIISGESILVTVIVYSLIFFLIFLNAARQVRFSRTINLINSDKAGEKPPKANWFIGILGLVILLSGYFLALKIEQPLSALQVFFIAVILTIIGTYLVLIAGSVVLCRILQKNKKYYYKTNHFVSVSSMAYRMKRNGAGLASICILLTMILVMMSSTSALYVNREETLNNHYPRQINCTASNDGFSGSYGERIEKIKADVDSKTKEYGAEIRDCYYYTTCYVSGYFENGRLILDVDALDNILRIDYDNVIQVYFFGIDDYNRLTGNNEVLSSGEVLVGVEGNVALGDEITIGDESFRVAKKINYRQGDFKHTLVSTIVSTLFIIVDDLGDVASRYNGLYDYKGNEMLTWEWHYSFDTDLDEDKQMELSGLLRDHIRDELYQEEYWGVRCESRAEQRNDFVRTFGGLFFLGILLSVIFLVSCVLIIYYKQISEGFEDQSRFGIMQKVGMTKENIRNSINSQMLTVFLIPIVVACIHLAVVLPIIHKLLKLFGHNNMPLLLACAGICVLICGIFYATIYKITSNAYYKIVS